MKTNIIKFQKHFFFKYEKSKIQDTMLEKKFTKNKFIFDNYIPKIITKYI